MPAGPEAFTAILVEAIEDDKAALVQNRWRARQQRRIDELQRKSATKLQAAARGKATRKLLLPEHKVRTLITRRAARRIQRYCRLTLARNKMKAQCRGVLQKEGQLSVPFMGGMEIVVHKTYYCFTTDRQLCYQRLNKDKSPNTNSTKSINFRDMREVRAFLGEKLLCIGCEHRVFKFQFKDRAECEAWATNLVQLVNVAGFEIEGHILMASPEQVQDEEEEMKLKQRRRRSKKEPFHHL